MGKKVTMDKERKDALEYLAQTVAEYVENGFPLTHLCGDESDGKPDRKHVQRLQQALAEAGFDRSAQSFNTHPDSVE